MRTKQRSIGWLMGLVLVFAIGLTIAQGGPEVRWLARYWVVLAIVMMAVSWFWFVYVPQKSLKLAGGNRDRQRRLLEWVLKTPCFAGMKVHVRYILAANYQVAKRYAEAEALYRLILKDTQGNLEPGFESFIRQDLADTIEALGQRGCGIRARAGGEGFASCGQQGPQPPGPGQAARSSAPIHGSHQSL